MLAIKRSAGIAPEVNFREQTSHTPLPSAKPRGDVTRNPKTGVSVAQWDNLFDKQASVVVIG